MAFPVLLKKLFKNEGAGPELREDIIPQISASKLPDTYLSKGGGDVTGNLTVQSKNVVRSVNGTSANVDGNVTLSGLVKSVNNITADANGNVSVDISLTKDKVVNALGYTPPTTNTTYSSGTGISIGTDNAINLATVVTAGNGGPTANASPGFGGTFTVPYFTYDAYGRITARTNRTITLPAKPATELPNIGAQTYSKSCSHSNWGYSISVSRDAYGRLTAASIAKGNCECTQCD